MSEWLQALILGVIQGLTEFLPVSSSGHLVLFQELLGADFFASGEEELFAVVLHLGTLLPILWFYRRDIGLSLASLRPDEGLSKLGVLAWLRDDENRWLCVLVIVGTVPTGLMGITLHDRFTEMFASPSKVLVALLVTGALLLATRFVPADRSGTASLALWSALLIGVVQGCAITPGISRSGSTIAVALFLGIARADAARFSFLLSVPAILGAVVLQSKDGLPLDSISWAPLAIGFLAAVVVGYFSLVLLVALVNKGRLHQFTWYLWPAAIGGLILLG
jgi:undecaprenyl-diphosphatase